jgi:hypothetical protein
MRASPLLGLILLACTTAEDTELLSLDAAGFERVYADLLQGSVHYEAAPAWPTFDVTVTSWATADTEERASEKRAANRYEVRGPAPTLLLMGRSDFAQAGVDFDVVGPPFIDLYLAPDTGDVEIEGVRGLLEVSGDDVTLRDHEGNVDAFARGDLVAEVRPEPGGRVDLSSSEGDCAVWIPRWAPVHLIVRYDPDAGHRVDFLDWDREHSEDGSYEAIREPGTIDVRVDCRGGAVVVEEHKEPW